jgi:hypothetical protein
MSSRKDYLVSHCDEVSRHFRERTNIRRWIGSSKRSQIRALVDAQGIAVGGSEVKKGCIIPRHDVSVWGIKMHGLIDPSRGGQGKNKRPTARSGGWRLVVQTGGALLAFCFVARPMLPLTRNAAILDVLARVANLEGGAAIATECTTCHSEKVVHGYMVFDTHRPPFLARNHPER